MLKVYIYESTDVSPSINVSSYAATLQEIIYPTNINNFQQSVEIFTPQISNVTLGDINAIIKRCMLLPGVTKVEIKCGEYLTVFGIDDRYNLIDTHDNLQNNEIYKSSTTASSKISPTMPPTLPPTISPTISPTLSPTTQTPIQQIFSDYKSPHPHTSFYKNEYGISPPTIPASPCPLGHNPYSVILYNGFNKSEIYTYTCRLINYIQAHPNGVPVGIILPISDGCSQKQLRKIHNYVRSVLAIETAQDRDIELIVEGVHSAKLKI